jgi:hypothetical protein
VWIAKEATRILEEHFFPPTAQHQQVQLVLAELGLARLVLAAMPTVVLV